ncbi:hypothetical protein DH2020_046741 [Rehmannia glutinosa]|uniref:ABC transporter domain-containing protein n=1 Tax=Rehmannia glutinosa TaxID=99300 RepID=A0ABR0UAZ7_REHGL
MEAFSRSSVEADDEEALKWAALEKLPTNLRIRRGILTEEEGKPREVDIKNLGLVERKNLVERLLKIAEEGNEKFLLKLKERIQRVGLDLPTIEVRFEHLNVDADAYVGGRALPTVFNFTVNILEGILSYLHILPNRKKPFPILHDVSGIIKPGRMTLLLGPPSSGKTTLLLALAGKLDPELKVSGRVTYNGHEMIDFVPQRTSAYINMLAELSRREKEANIKPDPDLDVFMKAAYIGGQEASVVTDYIIKILGLEVCADTLVGDEMVRGISGGQRKRLTTGEMMVGPARALFMDEISTGLDSSTTFQIVNSIRQSIHILQGTAIISLLQPAPETSFLKHFSHSMWDLKLGDELAVPFPKGKSHPAALTKNKHGLILMASISMTVFLKTEMPKKTVTDGGIYMGALFYALIMIMFNGFSELALSILKLPVFYKQRDLLFFPPWAYSLPAWILKIPITLVEVAVWVGMTYYATGYDSDAGRFFKHLLLLICVNQMASALFRLMGALGRNIIVANTFGSCALLTVLVLGGFILSRDDIRKWWIWGYWISPLMYGQNAIAVNEFLGKSWNHVPPNSTEPVGLTILKSRGIFPEPHWYWIGVGAIVGYVFLFNFLVTLALTYLNPFGKPQAILSEETLAERIASKRGEHVELSSVGSRTSGRYDDVHRSVSSRTMSSRVGVISNADPNRKRGMILPFEPLSITFDDIRYAVDMPQEMKAHGVQEDRLELLKGVSGAFRPGVLTALMGISGAGKTTLMDVLAGRKTGGYINGTITISGYPKKQETFARIAGYCEQTDIHSPHVTVYESLQFSAWLRLPPEVDTATRKMFIEEVMELVELTPLKEALVGLPVELVANPSIIFMDEPTSGLDARAAAIVMRTVRNTVDTGRTVVCTIHQPSIDIFDAFDELLLLKRGGIDGISKIKDGYNPATWMLEVTSSGQEEVLGVDFAELYKNSELYRRNKALIKELSVPAPGSRDLHFPKRYSQSFWTQCMACLWKQHWSYWRNPPYTAVRLLFTTFIAVMFGTIFWDLGSKRRKQQDIFNAMGSMYAAVLFLGVQNATSVQPVVAIERTVFYRERAAGMYSALPYAFGQAVVELPNLLVQTLIYGVIVYAMIGFEWTVAKFFWYLFFMYFTLLYFTLYGMMTVAVTPNHNIAAIISSAFYALWNLFSGFIIPKTRIPVWWRWYYYTCPISWTLYGLVASQFGDVEAELDTNETVKEFVRNYFDFRHDFVGYVVIIAGIAVLFGFIFAFSIRAFNFQKR